MWLILALLVVGLVLIIKGGDVFVDAASWMAEKTGIPKLIVGATVVSLATTLPEMLVSFMAAAGGQVDMAIGNAMGSVTVNIGLIMGISIICMPGVVKRADYLKKSILMLAAAVILVAFGLTGSIGVAPSILLIVVFVVFMWENIHEATVAVKLQPVQPESETEKTGGKEIAVNVAKFVFGAAAIVLGSQLLVDNGSALAAMLGVPERVIAISVVAIGTSLPELVTTITAIAKKQSSLSVGNILGANIIDLTLILPVSALISGKALPVSAQFARFDLPACLLVGCIALLPMLKSQKFRRAQGVIMVCVYVAYLLVTTLVLG